MSDKQTKNITQNDNIQITLLTSVIALTGILTFINDKSDFQKSLAEISFAEIPVMIIIFIMVFVIIFCMKDVFVFYLSKIKSR